MDTNREQFNLFLESSAQKEYFPCNTSSSFELKFSKKINSSEAWECRLNSLFVPKFYTKYIKFSTSKCYTIQEFLNYREVKTEMSDDFFVKNVIQYEKKEQYDNLNGSVKITYLGSNLASLKCNKKYLLYELICHIFSKIDRITRKSYSEQMRSLSMKEQDDEISFYNANYLYIHTDIIAKSLFCNSLRPVILCVPLINDRKSFNEVDFYDCSHSVYHSVEKKNLDGVLCTVKSEYGCLKAKNSDIMTQIQLLFRRSHN